jgi:hypothetical protein
VNYTQLVVQFLRLRQACDHPFLGFDGYDMVEKGHEDKPLDELDFLSSQMNAVNLGEQETCQCGMEISKGSECMICSSQVPSTDNLEAIVSTKTLKV